jgi:hypothetical protein
MIANYAVSRLLIIIAIFCVDMVQNRTIFRSGYVLFSFLCFFPMLLSSG